MQNRSADTRKLILFVALFGCLGTYLSLVVSVYSNFEMLSPFLLAFFVAFGSSLVGSVDLAKMYKVVLAIILIWFVAWLVFCRPVVEKFPPDAVWYHNHRNDLKAHAIAVLSGIVAVYFYQPVKTLQKNVSDKSGTAGN